MTKEERKEYMKTYYKENKKHFQARSKETYNKNKDYWKKVNKEWLDKYFTGKFHVYKIDSADEYVGLTTNIYRRMSRHKNDGRDTSNYRILASFPTYKEARELEEFLHELGYPGTQKRTKL